ncbi:MAG TPA: type II toxin-antitoxin system RelE/ParE family toxin [Marinobacter sp.]|uniref:type II toxin-antitoxin system RelE family toxin n=1 Tax=Marinobacter sp. TaxID=50741 RepID=UPI002634DF6C|nr:type II toxin-antitoxin system RelE/ParE family toxin [Marinobacter sp.]HET8800097.1 type II toxin-antitoxin system RelE/ParE family toxin [Marinobacter sp.]
MYSLKYKKSALKALKKIPKPIAERLMSELETIALDPDNYHGDWKPMKGKPYWRLRQGGYRAICGFDKGELVLLVLKVGARGDVYK